MALPIPPLAATEGAGRTACGTRFFPFFGRLNIGCRHLPCSLILGVQLFLGE